MTVVKIISANGKWKYREWGVRVALLFPAEDLAAGDRVLFLPRSTGEGGLPNLTRNFRNGFFPSPANSTSQRLNRAAPSTP